MTDKDNDLNDPGTLFNPDESTSEIDLSGWWADPDGDEDNGDNSKKYLNEPEDNIGRKTCFWCSEPTTKKVLFNTVYDYCEKCKK